MSDWRLYSKFENGQSAGGRIEYVRMFTVIAIFIVIIACINVMNLATARSEKRAKEVGIRKTVGSGKNHLVYQFLSESIFITFLAFALSIVLVELALPAYSELIDQELSIPYQNLNFWLISMTIVITIGIFAGSYPAFFLSSFKPVSVLKGQIKIGKGVTTPRTILVVLQFGFSILLIIGTFVVYTQINHVKERDLGYERDNLMLVWTNTQIEKNYQTIKAELEKTPYVYSVCKSNSPITRIFSTNVVKWAGLEEGRRVEFTTIATEYDYAKTMGIKMIIGRDFSRDFASDSSAVVINKTAMKLLGKDDPIGEYLDFWGSKRTIIGVMDDVIMGSPFEPIAPLMTVLDPDWTSTISIRLESQADLSAAISAVGQVMKEYNPSHPFEFRFADDEFQGKYTSINLISNLSTLFAVLALFITGMGLFGLAAFTAERRTKEVGIRKVLGASLGSIVLLISRDFARLVLIAFVISAPLSWFVLDSFLEQYAYRINIPIWIMPLAGVIAMIMAVSVVSSQAVKAASLNPVKTLKDE
jgi:ABC-type antimicrobial peptide transport system permease subunit